MALGTAVIVGVGPGLGLALAALRQRRAPGRHARPRQGEAGPTPPSSPPLRPGRPRLRRGRLGSRHLRAAIRSAVTELGAPDVLVYNVGVLPRTRPLAATTRIGRTQRRSMSSAPGSGPTPSCPSCVTAAGPSCSPAAATRCAPPRNSRPCRSARPRSAPSAGTARPAGGRRACTRPASDHGGIGGSPRFDPAEIAQAYLKLHHQPAAEWQHELVY